MRQLPAGLYQPMDTVIHRLTAGAKLLCLILLLIAVVNTNTIPGYGIWIAFTFFLAHLARLSPRMAFGSAVRFKWFFCTILLMNLCFYESEEPWVRWWIFSPSYQGLIQGIHVVVRVILLLAMSNLLMASTAPLAMTEGLEQLLSPLRLMRVPTDLMAMILSVAIQFIPTLMEETDHIRKAQMARGARFDSPKLLDKAKAVLPLLVPVFMAAFKRADELSLAMEARGYRTDRKCPRKRYPSYKTADWLSLLLCAAIAVLFFFTPFKQV